MKNTSMIPGIILIGYGIYFYLDQANIVLFQQFHTWPTLMAIIGLAFLVQGYWGRDYDSILPGAILFGLGVHFHVVGRLAVWPDHLGAFILIIALGFLLRYQKSGNGLAFGILFLIVAALLLFYDSIAGWFGVLESGFAAIWNFWPAALILLGIYLLMKKR
jgi:hypothetical protein